jgi:hypothetical protein
MLYFGDRVAVLNVSFFRREGVYNSINSESWQLFRHNSVFTGKRQDQLLLTKVLILSAVDRVFFSLSRS